MKGKKKKQPYFPHNIKRIMDAPDEVFQEISYEDFHDWKLCGWELPDSIFCVFRVENKTTGKVKEKELNWNSGPMQGGLLRVTSLEHISC